MDADPLAVLLRELASGRPLSLDDLARAADAPPDLLEQMLLDLERAGYVRRVDCAQANHCADCPSAAACVDHTGGRIWAVTDKGFRAAKR
jgi:primosomal protein N'